MLNSTVAELKLFSTQLSLVTCLVSRLGPVCYPSCDDDDDSNSVFAWRIKASHIDGDDGDEGLTRITCLLTNNTGVSLFPAFWRILISYFPQISDVTRSSPAQSVVNVYQQLPRRWRPDGGTVSVSWTASSVRHTDLCVRCSLVFWSEERLTAGVSAGDSGRPLVCLPLFTAVIDPLTVAELTGQEQRRATASYSSPFTTLSVHVRSQSRDSSDTVQQRVMRRLGCSLLLANQQQDTVCVCVCGRCVNLSVSGAVSDGEVCVSVRGADCSLVVRTFDAVCRRLQPTFAVGPRVQRQRVAASLVSRVAAIKERVEKSEDVEELVELWSALEKGVCQHLPLYIASR